MDLLEYTYEVKGLAEAEKMFLNRIFTSKYANTLFSIFNNIKIVESKRKDDLVASAIFDKKININAPLFYSLSKQDQLNYITHELLHILMNKGDIKLRSLSRTLWKFYDKNRIKGADISDVMVGKHGISRRWINKEETVPYLMNYDIHFDYLKPGCKEELIKLLNKYGVFNLNDKFWKERLGL